MNHKIEIFIDDHIVLKRDLVNLLVDKTLHSVNDQHDRDLIDTTYYTITIERKSP